MAMHDHGGSHFRDEATVREFDTRLFKRLLLLLKPHWRVTLAAVALLLAGSFCSNATPRVVQLAIDGPLARHDLAGLLHPVLVFFALRAGAFVAVFFQVILTAWISQRVIRDLRLRLFDHIQSLSMAFFSKNPVGRLMSRTVNDTDVLNELFSSGLITVFGDIFSLLFIVGFMFSLNVKLTLVCLAILPPVLLFSSFFKKRMRDNFRKIRIKTADINAHLQESITGMSVIQLFNQEKNDAEKFDVHNREYFGYYKKTVHYFSLFYPVMEFLSALGLALVLWYGGLRHLDSGLTVGVLVAFTEYMRNLFNPIRDLAEKYNALQNAMASSERIFHVFDEKPSILLPADPVAPVDFRGGIEFRDVHFSYVAGRPVLDGVSFRVAPGETVAVVGATGAGKSTLLLLLNRFYEAQSGEVLLDNVPVSRLDPAFLRKKVGTVSQDLFIFSDTVRENIVLGDTLVPDGTIRSVAEYINAGPFIGRLPGGYDEVLMERGANLSTGQKQLLSFARVLCVSPSIIVLDEATSNIDPQTEVLVQEAVGKLVTGRTCLIVAHRLSTVRHADKIIVLHHGRVAESGTHEELVRAKGIYSKLYRLQFV